MISLGDTAMYLSVDILIMCCPSDLLFYQTIIAVEKMHDSHNMKLSLDYTHHSRTCAIQPFILLGSINEY